jgi:hypothetical protein
MRVSPDQTKGSASFEEILSRKVDAVLLELTRLSTVMSRETFVVLTPPQG